MNSMVRFGLVTVSLATFSAFAVNPVQVSTVAQLRTAVNSATTAGTSWDDPFVIEVADGTYDFEEAGLTAVTQEFLRPNVAWMKIVSASRDPGKCVFIGTAGSAEHDTSTRAITVGSSGNAWIEGITFTNFTRGTVAANGGAGAIYVAGCKIGQTVVTNCVFDFCTSEAGDGKTMACNASEEFMITDCRFLNCPQGSIILTYFNSPLTVRDCTFVKCGGPIFGQTQSNVSSLTVSGCTAYDCTGAIANVGTYTDCVFSNFQNRTTARYIDGFCSFTHCTFVGCSDYSGAGGNAFAGANNLSSGRKSFVNCTIVDCRSGMTAFAYCFFTNCLLSTSGCNAKWSVSTLFSDSELVNCTVLDCKWNTSVNSATTFRNDIITGCGNLSSAAAEHTIYDALKNGATLTGEGNEKMAAADIRKMFVGEGPTPYQLRSKRVAAVDNGAEVDWWLGATDLRGETRVIGPAVDIGCYEYRPKGLMMLLK